MCLLYMNSFGQRKKNKFFKNLTNFNKILMFFYLFLLYHILVYEGKRKNTL